MSAVGWGALGAALMLTHSLCFLLGAIWNAPIIEEEPRAKDRPA